MSYPPTTVPRTAVREGRTVDNPREHNEFARIELHQMIERDREIIGMYEDRLAELHEKIEGEKYKLGRLDERLGSDSA
jgi:hypothetical protein